MSPPSRPPPSPHELRLLDLVTNTGWLLDALHAAREVMPRPWCIAAGAVRSVVWNSLHGLAATPPNDLDCIYFDELSPSDRDCELSRQLTARLPQFTWDVVNQAHAHRLSGNQHEAAFASLEEAMSCWPETATAVGVSLDVEGGLQVISPFGLDDLFDLIVRPSAALRNPEVFYQRLGQKKFLERWPRLRVVLEAARVGSGGPRRAGTL